MADRTARKRGDLEEVLSEQDIQEIREAAAAWAAEMVKSGTIQGLSEEALRFIYVMRHPFTGNKVRRWAEIAGVDFKVYYRHRSSEAWKAALEQLSQQRRAVRLTRLEQGLEELMAHPDPDIRLKAIRTVAEIEGLFVRKVQHEHSVETPEQRARRRALKLRAQQVASSTDAQDSADTIN